MLYIYKYILQDNKFDLEVSLKAIVDMHFSGCDVLLGPENSCVVSARLAAALDMPMFGFVRHSILRLLFFTPKYQHPLEQFTVECDEWETASHFLNTALSLLNINI